MHVGLFALRSAIVGMNLRPGTFERILLLKRIARPSMQTFELPVVLAAQLERLCAIPQPQRLASRTLASCIEYTATLLAPSTGEIVFQVS